MPNPHSPGYHAHSEHGRLHLSAPHLSSLPQPFRPHTFTVQCLPALGVTSPSLGSWSDMVPSCSHQVRPQGREAQGWLLAGRTLAASGLQPPQGGSQTRAEHGLPSTFLHPHRDVALSGAAVPDLHQSCGIGADRGGIPSASCSIVGLLTNDYSLVSLLYFLPSFFAHQ